MSHYFSPSRVLRYSKGWLFLWKSTKGKSESLEGQIIMISSIHTWCFLHFYCLSSGRTCSQSLSSSTCLSHDGQHSGLLQPQSWWGSDWVSSSVSSTFLPHKYHCLLGSSHPVSSGFTVITVIVGSLFFQSNTLSSTIWLYLSQTWRTKKALCTVWRSWADIP